MTPTEVGMWCIVWFECWQDYKDFINGLVSFEQQVEEHGIPATVLKAFEEG